MSNISIKVDEAKSVNSSLGITLSRLSNVKGGISSIRYNLDNDIMNRRNIRARLTSAYNASNSLEVRLRHLESFINNSINNYNLVEKRLNSAAQNVGLIAVTNNAQFKKGPSGVVPKEKSFWEKLNVGVGAVVAKAKEVCAEFKKRIEPGGDLYQAYEVGKAVVDIGAGIFQTYEGIVLIGASGIAEVFSGGAATPIAVPALVGGTVLTVYGVDTTVSGVYDLVKALQGKYDEIGKVHLLKDGAEWAGGNIGKIAGHEKEGKTIGEYAYYAGSLATVFVGAAKSLKEIKNLDKFSFAGLNKEVSKISNKAATAIDKLNRVRGIKQLVKAANIDILGDLNKVKSVQDITKIKAIKTIAEINYGKMVKRAEDIVVKAINPIRKLVINEKSDLNIAYKVGKGIKSVIKIPFKVAKTIKEFQQENQTLLQN